MKAATENAGCPIQQLGAVPGTAIARTVLGCEGNEPDDNDNEAEYVPEDIAVLRANFLRLVREAHQGRFDTTREAENLDYEEPGMGYDTVGSERVNEEQEGVGAAAIAQAQRLRGNTTADAVANLAIPRECEPEARRKGGVITIGQASDNNNPLYIPQAVHAQTPIYADTGRAAEQPVSGGGPCSYAYAGQAAVQLAGGGNAYTGRAAAEQPTLGGLQAGRSSDLDAVEAQRQREVLRLCTARGGPLFCGAACEAAARRRTLLGV